MKNIPNDFVASNDDYADEIKAFFEKNTKESSESDDLKIESVTLCFSLENFTALVDKKTA